ncbi:hypothetical protein RBA41_19890 [Massilia sp. CCM 9210]|uniref:hypothetical protein n=1 Tax=Massilia scottii TaxID=3057166 RepID=UPI002796E165|nr:hypothetical protein [Massilia sp. CCM 9210]MDQ1815565.1 hypothetical protein [Massilia sp. CCM 9210]
MTTPYSYVIGEIFFTGSMDALSSLLTASGLPNSVGEWAIRLDGYPTFFEIAFVGNLSPEEPYHVDGDGYGMQLDAVALWCDKLSSCLRKNAIKHDFVHCTHENELCAYSA